MPLIEIRGVSINYRVVGGAGPPLALIPGGRHGMAEMASLAEKIAPCGFRVVLHDRRNTGDSGISFASPDGEEETWSDDLYLLLHELGMCPASVGGSSSGARTAIRFALRYPDTTTALLLLRLSGGSLGTDWLPEVYYDQYIRAAEQGGMKAVLETEYYATIARLNANSRTTLEDLDPRWFIETMKRWRERFLETASCPVMGATPDELASIGIPALVVPGNDLLHNRSSAIAAHRLMPGSVLHDLKLQDEDVSLIPFATWRPYEAEIAKAFCSFMQQNR